MLKAFYFHIMLLLQWQKASKQTVSLRNNRLEILLKTKTAEQFRALQVW